MTRSSGKVCLAGVLAVAAAVLCVASAGPLPGLHASGPEAAAAPPRRSPPATMADAVRRHCGEVTRVIEELWLPRAPVGGVNGSRTVHVAFIGDSLSFHQYDRMVEEVRVCTKAHWAASFTAIPYRRNPVPMSARVSFARRGGSGGAAAQVVLTFTRVRYTWPLVKNLVSVYAPSPTGLSAAAANRGWQRWSNLPSPQVIYAGSGSWDVYFPRIESNGYTQVNAELIVTGRQSPTWPEKLMAYDAFLEENVTQPLRRLVAAWGSGGSDATGAVVPARSPPRYFYWLLPTQQECSTPLSLPPRGGTKGRKRDSRWHMRGTARCNGAVRPAVELIHRHLKAALADPAGQTSMSLVGSPARVGTVDINEFRDICGLNDGVHITVNSPRCRERLMLDFWGLF